MKPGRKLDANIAIHIMGQAKWDVYDNDLVGDPPDGYVQWVREDIPYYSTDVAAAFAVDKPDWFWKFQETTQLLTVVLYTSFEMLRESVRDYPVAARGSILVRRQWLDSKVQTYAWLRCLAALEATGLEAEND